MASTEYGHMSEEMKRQLADRLGFAETVRREGHYGSLPAKACGDMVRLAVELAERELAGPAPAP